MTDGPSTFSAGNSGTAHTNTTEHSHTPARGRIGADHKAVSLRTFSRLTFIGAVLAAALLLGFTVPAHADSGASRTFTWILAPEYEKIAYYEYGLSTDNGITWDPDWTVIAGSDANTTSFLLTGLTYGITYKFQLRAVNIYNTKGASAEVTFTPLFAAPSNLVALPNSGWVGLEWDTHSEVTSYRVDTKVTSTDAFQESSLIPARSGPTTTATVLKLIDGTAYTFTVVAVQGSLDTSEPSNVIATPAVALSADVTVSPQKISAPEGGSEGYAVALNTPPTAEVTIMVRRGSGGDTDLTASPETLTFTNLNWNTLQTVTVSAAEDADSLNGTATFSHSFLGGDDPDYNNDDLTPPPVTATEADNDKDRTRPRVTITSAAAAPVTGAFEVTIRFSESVYGFRLTDIDVHNGTAAHFKKRSSRTYTVTITPAASGEVRVEVGANVARDRAGNGNQPAVPFVIAAALEAAALQSRFESPAAGATVSGIDLIRGWTFAEAAGVEIAEVVVYIDGQRETPIPCCSERPDVQAAYPAFPAANTVASGWGLTYNWGELAAGTHTLRVVATSSQGDTWESADHTIHVLKPGEVVFADRFSLATAEVWLEAEELVLDGVVIRDKASQEAQEIEARYGWQTAVQGLQLVETTPIEPAPVESVRAGVARLLAGLAAWGRWLLSPGQVTAAAGLTAAYEAPADQTVVVGIGLIRGWAFADMGRELATVSLHIDEAASGPVPCCSRRPDVAAAYPDEGGALDSGWGLVVNYGNLAVGAHTIGVRITTEAGDVETTEHTVRVVQLGGYAFVDVFDVSGAEVWIEGEEIVLSGVEVRDKATQATQLVEVRLRWSSVTQGLTIVGSEPVP